MISLAQGLCILFGLFLIIRFRKLFFFFFAFVYIIIIIIGYIIYLRYTMGQEMYNEDQETKTKIREKMEQYVQILRNMDTYHIVWN